MIPINQPVAPPSSPAPDKVRRASREFDKIDYLKGYRNREDKTNMPPGYLVSGSQNVLSNVSDRITVRNGYTLDGQANNTINSILASYDWVDRFNDEERHLRAWSDKLQYRFVDSGGVVIWRDLLTGTVSPRFRFAEFWDTTELIDELLFVNGQSEINEWSGGVTTFLSSGAGTVTKQGSSTWAEEGFYVLKAGRSFVLNGVTYTYTGGENTTTLTGVVPAVVVGVAGDVIHQSVVTTPNSAMTGIPASFKNDLISNLYNQVYVGSESNRTVYVSKVNDYTDYSFTSPARLVGEGANLLLDGSPRAFIPQNDLMYISAGKDQWYQTQFQTTTTTINIMDVATTTAYETLNVQRLKTSSRQGARSQEAVVKVLNNVGFISFEPTLTTLGNIQSQQQVAQSYFNTPQIYNLSDPIKLDFDQYNFTDTSVFYHRYFTYVAVPREGLVRIYNHVKEFWEAPQLIPVGRFAVIDGELYGHGYHVPETYKLFTGTNDNGNPIDARAVFSFQNFGSRDILKKFNEFYTEGYISSNTTLNLEIKYEVVGCGFSSGYAISGSDPETVCLGFPDNHLGFETLGKFPLGSTDTIDEQLPPKFRIIHTMSGDNDFYEMQVTYSSNNVDQRWELLTFGPQVRLSDHDSVQIKK